MALAPIRFGIIITVDKQKQHLQKDKKNDQSGKHRQRAAYPGGPEALFEKITRRQVVEEIGEIKCQRYQSIGQSEPGLAPDYTEYFVVFQSTTGDPTLVQAYVVPNDIHDKIVMAICPGPGALLLS